MFLNYPKKYEKTYIFVKLRKYTSYWESLTVCRTASLHMNVLAIKVAREHVLTAVSVWNIIWIGIWEHKWLRLSSAYPWVYSKYISGMYSWSWRSQLSAEYWPKICRSQGQTWTINANTDVKLFQVLWHHLLRVYVQAEVTHGTWVRWPPQSSADEFPAMTMPTQSTKYLSTINSYAVAAQITSAFRSAHCPLSIVILFGHRHNFWTARMSTWSANTSKHLKIFKIYVYARLSTVLRSNTSHVHIHGSSLGNPWMQNPTKTC